MITIAVKCQLELPGVSSLKEKRRRLKSLMTRVRNDFNVSISEVGDNDVLRRAIIGVAVVANSTSYAHQVMSKVVARIGADPNLLLADYVTETY